jgi:hypothetical protein
LEDDVEEHLLDNWRDFDENTLETDSKRYLQYDDGGNRKFKVLAVVIFAHHAGYDDEELVSQNGFTAKLVLTIVPKQFLLTLRLPRC